MEQKERNEHLLGRWPRKCKECGKKFFANDDYVYKHKRGPHDAKWFCSWSCMRKYEKEQEAKKK